MENEKHKYTVTVETTVSYDIEVEAESFNDASEQAIDKTDSITDQLVTVAASLAPEKVLNYWDTNIRGVHKQG